MLVIVLLIVLLCVLMLAMLPCLTAASVTLPAQKGRLADAVKAHGLKVGAEAA